MLVKHFWVAFQQHDKCSVTSLSHIITSVSKGLRVQRVKGFEIRPPFVEPSSNVVIIEDEVMVMLVESVVGFVVEVEVVVDVVVGTSWHSKVSQGHPLRQLS